MNSYAQAYITAVETADGQSLETWYKNAVNRLVIDLIRTNAVTQASLDSLAPNLYIHLFCGARSLTGMLIPLFPASFASMNNVGFVLADYNRKTGLKAGGTKRLTIGNDYPNNITAGGGYWPNDVSDTMCAYCNLTETHSEPTETCSYITTHTGTAIQGSDIWLGQYYSPTRLDSRNLSRVRGGSITSNSAPANVVSTGLTGFRRVGELLSGTTYGNRRQSKNGSVNNQAISLGSPASNSNGSGSFSFFNSDTLLTGHSNGNFRMNAVAFGATSASLSLESSLLTFLNTLDQNNF
jgi:hypothetical protein